ncbi:Predicted oxidoreductase, contains short-chain dehydrogenase (SDR) and DUF2520 domains [Eubacterium ruminantium]|nr:Predicted oxidoreductase, contains short-chain dehydrogenase (SDR) and DUF2520 domains [Eubacterium ruminantium]
MRIGFIGAGKVGCTLGKYLKIHGKDVTGYYNRSAEAGREAAGFTDTLYYDNVNDLIRESDAIILTVSDNAIPQVFNSLDKGLLRGKIIAHTSGAMSSSVFSGSKNYGFFSYSIHPIYAVSDKLKSYENFQNAFITIEGDAEKLEELKELFTGLGNSVSCISSDSKVRYHSAAVFASNLVCGLYETASNILISCGFTEEDAHKALKGLFLDNAQSVAANGPVNALTGPIERNDTETVRKHITVLSEKEAELYRAASEAVLGIAVKKHPERDYTEMSEILKGEGFDRSVC